MASSAASGQSPRAREIAAAALALLEEDGPDGLSMRRVAERVGIRAPSLYKHIPDKEALEAAIISEGFADLADAFDALPPGGPVALAGVMRAYRDFALRRPHLYRLMTGRPLARDLLAPGVEARAAQPLLEATGGDDDLARAAWAFAHGMTILELNGRFPPGADLDRAWRAGVEALAAAGGAP